SSSRCSNGPKVASASTTEVAQTRVSIKTGPSTTGSCKRIPLSLAVEPRVTIVPLVHILIHALSSVVLLHRGPHKLIASSQFPSGSSVGRSGAIAAPPFDRLLV